MSKVPQDRRHRNLGWSGSLPLELQKAGVVPDPIKDCLGVKALVFFL
jgi:hypothetical protein